MSSETGNTGEGGREERLLSVQYTPVFQYISNPQILVTDLFALLSSCRFPSLGAPGAAFQPLLLNLWILRLAFLPILPTLTFPLCPPPQ